MSDEKKETTKERPVQVTQRKNLQEQAHDAVTRRLVESQKIQKQHRVEAIKTLSRQFGADGLMESIYAKSAEIDAIRKACEAENDPREAQIERLVSEIAGAKKIRDARIHPIDAERSKMFAPVVEMGFHIQSAWKYEAWDPKSTCLAEGQLPPSQFDITHCSDAGQALRGLMSSDTDRINKLKDAVPEIDVICWRAEFASEIVAELKAIGVDLTD